MSCWTTTETLHSPVPTCPYQAEGVVKFFVPSWDWYFVHHNRWRCPEMQPDLSPDLHACTQHKTLRLTSMEVEHRLAPFNRESSSKLPHHLFHRPCHVFGRPLFQPSPSSGFRAAGPGLAPGWPVASTKPGTSQTPGTR